MFEGVFLTRAEAGFAFGGEEGGDRPPRVGFDFGIEVNKGEVEVLGEDFPDGGFAGAGGAVEEDGCHWVNE